MSIPARTTTTTRTTTTSTTTTTTTTTTTRASTPPVSRSPNVQSLSQEPGNDFPVWQPDRDSSNCCLCNCEFTFFNRRHHCRMCGLLVCGSCSSNMILYYPGVHIVRRPYDEYSISLEYEMLHRTCDSCMANIHDEDAFISANASSLDDTNYADNLVSRRFSSRNFRTPTQDIGISKDQRSVKEEDLCPVCRADLRIFGADQAEKEEHINDCFLNSSGSPIVAKTISAGSMLVYNLPKDYKGISHGAVSSKIENLNDQLSNECCICLEEFKPNDKVGRLQCLCMFHYNCIKDWFNKKGTGECPVHMIQR